jgi:hypothetical protein
MAQAFLDDLRMSAERDHQSRRTVTEVVKSQWEELGSLCGRLEMARTEALADGPSFGGREDAAVGGRESADVFADSVREKARDGHRPQTLGRLGRSFMEMPVHLYQAVCYA